MTGTAVEFTITVTSALPNNSESLAVNRSRYVPGREKPAVVTVFPGFAKSTVPGPLILLHTVVMVLPTGRKSSLTRPTCVAEAGSEIDMVATASTEGGPFGCVIFTVVSALLVKSESVALRRNVYAPGAPKAAVVTGALEFPNVTLGVRCAAQLSTHVSLSAGVFKKGSPPKIVIRLLFRSNTALCSIRPGIDPPSGTDRHVGAPPSPLALVSTAISLSEPLVREILSQSKSLQPPTIINWFDLGSYTPVHSRAPASGVAKETVWTTEASPLARSHSSGPKFRFDTAPRCR